MGANTGTQRFSEQTIKQAQLDCKRAMVRARFCADRSEVLQMRCVDYHPESVDQYGNQLWYFEGEAFDSRDRCHLVYGVVEYSTQYGINELVEDGVYDSEHQREKYRNLYERDVFQPTWRHPAHHWLAAGLIAVSSIWLLYLLGRTLML